MHCDIDMRLYIQKLLFQDLQGKVNTTLFRLYLEKSKKQKSEDAYKPKRCKKKCNFSSGVQATFLKASR